MFYFGKFAMYIKIRKSEGALYEIKDSSILLGACFVTIIITPHIKFMSKNRCLLRKYFFSIVIENVSVSYDVIHGNESAYIRFGAWLF